MDDICCRFPEICSIIFGFLDNKTLVRCRLVNNNWKNCVDNLKILWIKIIQKYFGDPNKYPDTWKKVLDKTPFPIIKKLGLAVVYFFQNPVRMIQCHTMWTPLHIAAEQGQLELCRYIIEKTEKNQYNADIATPLHLAAENGHIDICRLLFDNAFERNPKNKEGLTPLHVSAEKGHLHVFQFLSETIGISMNKVVEFYIIATPLIPMNNFFLTFCKTV